MSTTINKNIKRSRITQAKRRATMLERYDVLAVTRHPQQKVITDWFIDEDGLPTRLIYHESAILVKSDAF